MKEEDHTQRTGRKDKEKRTEKAKERAKPQGRYTSVHLPYLLVQIEFSFAFHPLCTYPTIHYLLASSPIIG
jgi:hypothetical protein